MYLEKSKCGHCGIDIIKRTPIKFLCGSVKLKTGCSYKQNIRLGRLWQRKKVNKDKPRYKILEKLGRECNHCHLKSDIEGFFDVDHIIPIKRPHPNQPNFKITKKFLEENKDWKLFFQILCPNCHRLKTIEDRKKYLFGMKVIDL